MFDPEQLLVHNTVLVRLIAMSLVLVSVSGSAGSSGRNSFELQSYILVREPNVLVLKNPVKCVLYLSVYSFSVTEMESLEHLEKDKNMHTYLQRTALNSKLLQIQETLTSLERSQ